ncbi:hypothetical protein [Streptomyces parvulus]|uniref:hypothetical protein n=1 Tax=Streptomyces parvulus TaxID=146923 RepID=UPI0036BD3149
MSKKPTEPDYALHCHAYTGGVDRTAMRPEEATKLHHTAALISAVASLITALTGVVVLLLHYA